MKLTPEEQDVFYAHVEADNAWDEVFYSTVFADAANADKIRCDCVHKKTRTATDIDELINLEMVLTTLDRVNHPQSAQPKIDKVLSEYQQLRVAVGQMRESPVEYLRGNVANKETRGDYRVLPKDHGITQINGNVRLLESWLEALPTNGQRAIFEARIEMANKSKQMLNELHHEAVKNYEQIPERKRPRLQPAKTPMMLAAEKMVAAKLEPDGANLRR